MPENRFTPKDVALLYDKLPATEINRRTGLKLHRVYAMLEESGTVRKSRGRRPVLISPGKDILEGLLAAGKSQRSIAKKLHVSRRTVQRWLARDEKRRKKD